MSTYILQKDFMSFKTGDEAKWDDTNKRYTIGKDFRENFCGLSKDVVIDNPEWFKLKEENSDIENASKLLQSNRYGKFLKSDLSGEVLTFQFENGTYKFSADLLVTLLLKELNYKF